MTNKPTEHDGQPIGVHAYECRKCGKGIEAMRADPVCKATPQEPDDDAELRELRDMRNVIVSCTRDVTVGHLLDLFKWQSVAERLQQPYSGIVDEADFTRGDE